MTVKELQEWLNSFEPTARVLVGSDEELNTIYEGFEVAVYGDDDDIVEDIIIYPLSTTELEQ
jgi:predicted glycosyltransferase